MNLIELLSEIRTGGGEIKVVGHDLRLRVPAGLLSPDDKQVLRAHRQDLLRLLGPAEQVVVDEEREAIQWVEALSPEEAEVVVETALREWRDLVGWAETPVVDPVKEAEVVEWDDCVDPPPPCERCGSLELWQTAAGSWHCQRCDPPIRSEMLRLRAARLRREAAERLADPSVLMYGAKGRTMV